MIAIVADLVVGALTLIVSGVVALLPEGDLGLPSPSGVGAWVGEHAGPADRYLPVAEMAAGLMIFVTVFMPAAAVYMLVTWAYRHIPVFGAG